jgi:solute carrier family 25 folate transporter 32
MDMVKLQLQNQATYKRAIDVFISIWKQNGISGLYRGVYPTIAGYLPTWMIYFTIYDESKKWYNSIPNSSLVVSHIMSALQAGIASTLLTNPLWVARSITFF